jgi:glyoxylase-like metal-dependent hydrolase (beta-lactamase superfamily II)
MIDRRWTDPLPINVYLIDHPEGLILFDTGESFLSTQHGFFPLWQPFFRLSIDIRMGQNESIGAKLAARSIDPARDLKAVILSHLHHDHGDGVIDVRDAPIYLSKEHWDAFANPRRATMEGAVPQHWPHAFRPNLLEPTGGPIGPWERTFPVTSDGTIFAVDLPGHMPGHIGLLVRAGDVDYLLAGDAAYDLELLDREVTDGINEDPFKAIETMRRIKRYAQGHPVVVLLAHDPRAARRLSDTAVYQPSQLLSGDVRGIARNHRPSSER